MFKNSIFLSVVLSLVLASCGSGGEQAPDPDDSTPAPPIPAPAPEPVPGKPTPPLPVKGKVNVGSGAGTVELKLGKAETVVATGKVESDGKFEIGVPNGGKEVTDALAAGTDLLKDLGCEGSLKISEESLKAVAFRGVSLKRGKKNVNVYHSDASFSWFPPTSKFTSRIYVYADKETKMSGNLECAKFLDKPDAIKSIKTKVDISLNKGWNVIRLKGATSGISMPVSATATLKNSSFKNGSSWFTLAYLNKEGRP